MVSKTLRIRPGRPLLCWLIVAIPILSALWVWFSSLSFVPVPWPDDSAFYFVAKELFKWPPRWVMLPQAPFEPTYRIWNFNTMPLYPMMVGLGRFIGIDGSWALKFWPLSGWALSGSLLAWVLYRSGLPLVWTALIALAWGMDPVSRWASVLVRPESMIGLCGVALVLGLTFGFPRKWQPRRFWDPVAALLIIAAYMHFNAVHLLFPVVLALAVQPKRLIQIGLKGLLYLSPWFLTILIHFNLFREQMALQFTRLNVGNSWLESLDSALSSLFQSMGSPEPWPSVVKLIAVLLWVFIFAASGIVLYRLSKLGYQLSKQGIAWAKDYYGIGQPAAPDSAATPAPAPTEAPQAKRPKKGSRKAMKAQAAESQNALGAPNAPGIRDTAPSGSVLQSTYYEGEIPLLPATGWVIGSVWLWHTKPEVWFTYYIHVAIWTFAGILLLKLLKMGARLHVMADVPSKVRGILTGLVTAMVVASAGVFIYVNVTQERALANTRSWHWDRYYELVDCVDNKLKEYQAGLGNKRDLSVWCPTFPDITIELSRRHPDWDLTRTNDFYTRWHLGVEHGKQADAVVITETINYAERDINAPMSQHPDIQSSWMTWSDYYLNALWREPGWKPNRWLCQYGRWQAFIFMK